MESASRSPPTPRSPGGGGGSRCGGGAGRPAPPRRARANRLPVERGAMVVKAEPGGPADVAGIQPGDVITSVEGDAVKDVHQLHEALGRRRVGSPVLVEGRRGGGA